jgi:adenylate kinase
MSYNMPGKKSQIFILLGRSGCGKGTQAKLLLESFNLSYLSSGDLLRERSQEGDFTGEKLKKVMDGGDLVPTPIMFSVWAKKIEGLKQKVDKQGLVIDGSPRSLGEAKLMDSVFKWYEWSQVKIFLLDISEEEALGRLTKRRICKKCGRLIPWVGEFKKLKKCDKCGGELETRFDDKPKAIKARLDFYNKDVQPAVDYYQKQGRLMKIDGEQSIDDVYKEIKKWC